MKTKGTEVLGR